MSVIKSLDEWWEAFEAKRLEYFNGATWGREQSSALSIASTKESITERRYRWAPEELTLVEWEGKLYDEDLALSKKWIPEREGLVIGWKRTGRTVTGVIKGADDE